MSKCALCKTSLKDDEINVCDKCRLDFLNFKQQRSEKDKEIEKLKNFMSKWHFENFESFENHYNYLMSLKNREQLMVENEAMKETIANLLGQKKTSSKEIRKQVCDEIREKIKKCIIEEDISYWNTDYGDRCWLYALEVDMTKILDQIEGNANGK